jgi:hypothetical protein
MLAWIHEHLIEIRKPSVHQSAVLVSLTAWFTRYEKINWLRRKAMLSPYASDGNLEPILQSGERRGDLSCSLGRLGHLRLNQPDDRHHCSSSDAGSAHVRKDRS